MNRQQRRAQMRAAAKLGIPRGGDGWTPLILVENAGLVGSLDAVARRLGCDVSLVEEVAQDTYGAAKLYMNALFEVQMAPAEQPEGWTHLTVRRRDGGATIGWRDLQRIKNQLCGESAEGVQLHPSEERLLDLDDAFHLWVAPPGEHLPIGYHAGRTAD